MVESMKPTRRRARRSTKVSRDLEAARAGFTEQLALQRDREAAVVAGLAAYFEAGQKIAAAEADCAERVRPLERAIEDLREKRDRLVTEQEVDQATAALAIHEADRTVEQVGELLELSEKSSRKLIAEGRRVAGGEEQVAQAGPSRDSATTPAGSASGPDAVAAGEVLPALGLLAEGEGAGTASASASSG